MIDQKPAARRTQLLTVVAILLTVAGVALAALHPPWLTGPLQAAVANAGPAAPAVFVALCILAAPLHLNGVLVVLSLLIWPMPVAAALSYIGSLVGCAGTAALLARAGAGPARGRDGWPAWLEKLSRGVSRRPLLTGIAARLVLHSGIALEAFYLLTGYTRRQYLTVTSIGLAVWITQAFVGVTVLTVLLEISPWLGTAVAVLPIALLATTILLRRRRKAVRSA
jgi:hypothetical protein